MHRGNRGQRGQQGYYNNTPNYGQVYAINETEGDTEYYTDNCDPSLHHSPVFCLDIIHQDVHQVHTNPGKKYFANILTSSMGSKFHHVKFQIDTAATCKTMSHCLMRISYMQKSLSLPSCCFYMATAHQSSQLVKLALYVKERRNITH